MGRALVVMASLVLTPVAIASSRSQPVETHVIPTGRAPCGTAVRGGELWVGVYEAGNLLRLDAGSGRVTRQFRVGRWACRVAIAGDAAWVTRDRAGVVVRVNLRSGRRKAFELGASPFDVIVAAGSLWVTSFDVGTVAELDARTSRLRRVYKHGPNPAGLASCGGRIWVGHGKGLTWLTSIDPRTHRLRRVQVGERSPGWPRCNRGQLWVTTPTSVLRVDTASGKVLGRLRLGGTPAEAAAGPDGLVWVTDKERSLVHRVDPKQVTLVDSFAAGPGAYSLARAGEAMWITSFAGADVRRYDP
jgi:streptogramin lyase